MSSCRLCITSVLPVRGPATVPCAPVWRLYAWIYLCASLSRLWHRLVARASWRLAQSLSLTLYNSVRLINAISINVSYNVYSRFNRKSRPAWVDRCKDHVVSPPPFRRRHRLCRRPRAAALACPALARLTSQVAAWAWVRAAFGDECRCVCLLPEGARNYDTIRC